MFMTHLLEYCFILGREQLSRDVPEAPCSKGWEHFQRRPVSQSAITEDEDDVKVEAQWEKRLQTVDSSKDGKAERQWEGAAGVAAAESFGGGYRNRIRSKKTKPKTARAPPTGNTALGKVIIYRNLLHTEYCKS